MSDSLLKVAVRDHLGQATPIASNPNGFLKISTPKLTDSIYGNVVEPHEDGDLHAVFGLQEHYSCKVTTGRVPNGCDLEIDVEGHIFVSDEQGISKLTLDLNQIYRVVVLGIDRILNIGVSRSRVLALSGDEGVNKIFSFWSDSGEFEKEINYDPSISGSSGGHSRFNKEMVVDLQNNIFHSAGAGAQCINASTGSVVWGVNYDEAPEDVSSAASASKVLLRDGLLYVLQAGGGWIVHDASNGDIVNYGSLTGTATGIGFLGSNLLLGRTTGNFSEYLSDSDTVVTRVTDYTAVHRLKDIHVTDDFIYCVDQDRIVCFGKDFKTKWVISPVTYRVERDYIPSIGKMIVTGNGKIYIVRNDFTVLCLSSELQLKGYRI